jgi:hypothetical protein
MGVLLALLPAHAEPARRLIHDGSPMTLSVTGDDLEISYLEVPAALREQGVTPGTPLVRGQWDGMIFTGQAFLFAAGCSPIAYPIRGVVDRANSLVVIGPAPVSCNDPTLTWNDSAVMRFDPPPSRPPREQKKPKAEKPKSKPKSKPKPKPEVRRRPAASAPSPWAPYQQQYQWRW